jgi:Bacterial membrane protein YfhO
LTRGARFFAFLAASSSLLPALAAALPLRTYYFRDFTVTFYPLRLFAARELQAGRLAFWNPYIYEGSFVLPVLYPLDLLHAFAPGPAVVSWLLTLHLPVAALAAYALARELGAEPPGAFAAGVVYALGGLALSSLNLYVFLQALALAPFVVLLLRRAATRGGRTTLLAALSIGLATTTLAVEFVGQAVLLGIALGLAAAPRASAVPRLALAVALGLGLASVPVVVTASLLRETVRGAGFEGEIALGNALHPAALLQSVLPNLFGTLSRPVEAWWGGRFFTKGFPYFLSHYVGPLALALALSGARALERKARVILLVLAALALWYALGAHGRLAPLLALLPPFSYVRFPSKALLLPHIAIAVCAGLGLDRLRRGEGWKAFAGVLAAVGTLVLALALVMAAGAEGWARWSGVAVSRLGEVTRVLRVDAAWALAMVLAGLLLSWSTARGSLPAPRAVAWIAAVLVLDLVRAGRGMNPQTAPSFYEPLPEMARLGLAHLDGGRVFSYGVETSPAFRRLLARGGPHLSLASFFVDRQVLGPYTNVVDRVETPEATDLTSFVPRPRELGPESYDPGAVDALLPWMRNAAVVRVLSLDPLEHRDLEPLARVDAGAGAEIHAYALRDPWPRAFVACRATVVGRDEAYALPYSPGFDAARQVALEEPAAAACTRGLATREVLSPQAERYLVETDGPGVLVMRDSFARGWTAAVGGRAVSVLRANGKHRAVPVPAGRHEVSLRYEPPGLETGVVLTVLSAAFLGVAWWRTRARP